MFIRIFYEIADKRLSLKKQWRLTEHK